MKKLICIIWLLCTLWGFSDTLFAKNDKVNIKLVNEQQQALKGVSIVIENSQGFYEKKESNHKGYISLYGIDEGKYTIEIDKQNGYLAQSDIEFHVSSNHQDSLEVTITLYQERHHVKPRDYSVLFIFLAMMNVVAYSMVLTFQNKTFTQFLDEVML